MTAYGMLNAITRTSQDLEDYKRATALERDGSRVLSLPASSSGTKLEKISRLLTQTEIQRCLREYGLKQGDQPTVEQIQTFADTYKGRELKEMCRTVGWRGQQSTQWRQVSSVGALAASAGVRSVMHEPKKRLGMTQCGS